MLYISRCLSADSWGVVDTDDYTETRCTMSDLVEACVHHGLDIKGVVLDSASVVDKSGEVFVTKFVKKIDVYQNPSFLKTSQVKSEFLKGISIKTSGTEIVSITAANMKENTFETIRLSDYGTRCANYILKGLVLPRDSRLVIVIDDKIKLSRFTFCGIADIPSVLLDLVELNNEKTRENLYTTNSFRQWYDDFKFFIADRQETFDFYLGVGLLIKGVEKDEFKYGIGKLVSNPVEVCAKLDDRFGSMFMGVLECEVNPTDTTLLNHKLFGYLSRNVVRDFMKKVENGEPLLQFCTQWSSCIVDILADAGVVKKSHLRMLTNYVLYFDVAEKYKEGIVDLCKRTVKWVFDYAVEKGLVFE